MLASTADCNRFLKLQDKRGARSVLMCNLRTEPTLYVKPPDPILTPVL